MFKIAMKKVAVPSVVVLLIIFSLVLPTMAQEPVQKSANNTVLLVTNSANVNQVLVGGTVMYTYSITNDTDQTLTITGTDDTGSNLLWIPVGSGTFGPPTQLAPGGKANATASYTIQASDLPGPFVNTVMVTGTVSPGTGTLPVIFTAQASSSVNISQKYSVDPNDPNAQTLITDDGVLSLIIPPKALPSNAAYLVYTPQTQQTLNVRFFFNPAGVLFSIELLDSSDNVINSPTFHPPLLATLQYDDADLPSNLPNGSENWLFVYVYDKEVGIWEKVPVISRDTVGNTITVYLSHLTSYALGGPRNLFFPNIFKPF